MPSILSKPSRKMHNPTISGCKCESCLEDRLTFYLTEMHKLVSLNYDSKDIQQHKEHIENLVDIILAKLGELFPVFQTHGKLPNGSFYQETKLLEPNEFDYLAPLKISTKDFTIVPQGNKPDCRKDVISKYLTKSLKDCENERIDYISYKQLLNPVPNEIEPAYILELLYDAVITALKQLEKEGKLVFKGECYFVGNIIRIFHKDRKDEKITLKHNEVVLDDSKNGPCITFAVGGHLCTTHVDITLCLEDYTQECKASERFFILPSAKTDIEAWITTKYTTGAGFKELDKHHRKILVLLKFCLQSCRKYGRYLTFNSHTMKTIIGQHERICNGKTSLGGCFQKVARHIFRLSIKNADEMNDTWKNIHFSTNWQYNLCNFDFPPGFIIHTKQQPKSTDILFTAVLYTLIQFLESSPEAVDLVHTKDTISLFVQLICRHNMKVLELDDDTFRHAIYPDALLKINVYHFIRRLRDLRYRGADINDLLSFLPLPYPQYRLNPNWPIKITLAGTIEKVSTKKCLKWKRLIEKNLTGSSKFMSMKINCD